LLREMRPAGALPAARRSGLQARGQPGKYPEEAFRTKPIRRAANFFDGIEYWTGSGNDTITIDGTSNRSGSASAR